MNKYDEWVKYFGKAEADRMQAEWDGQLAASQARTPAQSYSDPENQAIGNYVAWDNSDKANPVQRQYSTFGGGVDENGQLVTAAPPPRSPASDFMFGGSIESFNAELEDAKQRAYASQGRTATQLDPYLYGQDRNLEAAARDQQQQGLGMWQGLANGTGPSAAQSMYRGAVGDANANAMSMAASARGGAANSAAALRAGMNAGSRNIMGAGNQLATIRANEQIAGIQGYGNMAGQIRQGDVSRGQMGQAWAFGNAKLEADQRALNDARERFFYGNATERLKAQQDGLMRFHGVDLGEKARGDEKDRASDDRWWQAGGTAAGVGGTLLAASLGGGDSSSKPQGESTAGTAPAGTSQDDYDKWGF
jgi:hypothetical protein